MNISSRGGQPDAERAVGREPGKPDATAAPPSEEVDVWWGAFAGRTMLPSFLACLAATAVIAWITWLLVKPGWFKPAFVALAGVLWLLQIVRASYRYFGYNYRLTSCHLYINRGFLYGARDQLPLAAVARVLVKRGAFDRLVGVGEIIVLPADPNRPRIILEGVRKPARIAEEIRTWVKKAQSNAECRMPNAE